MRRASDIAKEILLDPAVPENERPARFKDLFAQDIVKDLLLDPAVPACERPARFQDLFRGVLGVYLGALVTLKLTGDATVVKKAKKELTRLRDNKRTRDDDEDDEVEDDGSDSEDDLPPRKRAKARMLEKLISMNEMLVNLVSTL